MIEQLQSTGTLPKWFALTAEDLRDDGPLSWMTEGLCGQTDPEAFFPPKGGSTRDAKAVCVKCTVQFQCLEYALANDERFGIWGGLSERQLRKMRQDRRAS